MSVSLVVLRPARRSWLWSCRSCLSFRNCVGTGSATVQLDVHDSGAADHDSTDTLLVSLPLPICLSRVTTGLSGHIGLLRLLCQCVVGVSCWECLYCGHVVSCVGGSPLVSWGYDLVAFGGQVCNAFRPVFCKLTGSWFRLSQSRTLFFFINEWGNLFAPFQTKINLYIHSTTS
jgi:hypothetical protein